MLSTVTVITVITVALLPVSAGTLHAASKEKIVAGVVFSGDLPFYREIQEELERVLAERGYAGAVRFIVQRPNPDTMAWSNAVRKVIAYDASLLITYGSGATRTAMYEAPSTPIMYAAVYEPERSGIKGRNIRGVGYKVPVSSIIRYLRKTGRIRRMGVMYSKFEPSTAVQYNDVRETCRTLSIDVVDLAVKKRGEIREELERASYDSIFLTSSALVNKYFPDTLSIITRKGMAVAAIMKGLEEYTIVTLAPDPLREGAVLAESLIKYIRSRDMEGIENAVVVKNSLTFNMRLSIELGLDIPVELLTESDRVIK